MKRIMAAIGLFLALVLMSISTSTARFTPNEQPAVLAAFSESRTRAINPDGEPFPIAAKAYVEEKSPAVAFGGGQYVLAFEQDGGIYLKVSSDWRTQPKDYLLTSLDPDCSHPAVAYDADSGWFIITYACSSAEIYAQVFEPITEFFGPSILISADASNDGSIAIACNATASSCLVAFEDSSSTIQGHYLTVENAVTGDLTVSKLYPLSDATEASGPRLAWGTGSGTYLLAYTVEHQSGAVFAAFTHVHDDETAVTGEAFIHSSTLAVPADVLLSGEETVAVDAAFDPCTQHFLLTVSHAAEGDGGDHDLWAAVLQPSAAEIADYFPIAATPADARGGAVRFITGSACRGKDRLFVAYLNEDDGVLAAELRGSSRPANPAYTSAPPEQHLLIDQPTSTASFIQVTLSPGGNGTQVLIVYVKNDMDGENDIWGRLVTLPDEFYLPLVLR